MESKLRLPQSTWMARHTWEANTSEWWWSQSRLISLCSEGHLSNMSPGIYRSSKGSVPTLTLSWIFREWTWLLGINATEGQVRVSDEINSIQLNHSHFRSSALKCVGWVFNYIIFDHLILSFYFVKYMIFRNRWHQSDSGACSTMKWEYFIPIWKF